MLCKKLLLTRNKRLCMFPERTRTNLKLQDKLCWRSTLTTFSAKPGAGLWQAVNNITSSFKCQESEWAASLALEAPSATAKIAGSTASDGREQERICISGKERWYILDIWSPTSGVYRLAFGTEGHGGFTYGGQPRVQHRVGTSPCSLMLLLQFYDWGEVFHSSRSLDGKKIEKKPIPISELE